MTKIVHIQSDNLNLCTMPKSYHLWKFQVIFFLWQDLSLRYVTWLMMWTFLLFTLNIALDIQNTVLQNLTMITQSFLIIVIRTRLDLYWKIYFYLKLNLLKTGICFLNIFLNWVIKFNLVVFWKMFQKLILWLGILNFKMLSNNGSP